jgi:hypothetical protein
MTEIVTMLERRRQRRLNRATLWIAGATVAFWIGLAALIGWAVAR